MVIQTKNVKVVSFNFHTAYPDIVYLSLSQNDKKETLDCISKPIDEKYSLFNLKVIFGMLKTYSKYL